MSLPPDLPNLCQKDKEFAWKLVTDWHEGSGRHNSGELDERQCTARNARRFVEGDDYFQLCANHGVPVSYSLTVRNSPYTPCQADHEPSTSGPS